MLGNFPLEKKESNVAWSLNSQKNPVLVDIENFGERGR